MEERKKGFMGYMDHLTLNSKHYENLNKTKMENQSLNNGTRTIEDPDRKHRDFAGLLLEMGRINGTNNDLAKYFERKAQNYQDESSFLRNRNSEQADEINKLRECLDKAASREAELTKDMEEEHAERTRAETKVREMLATIGRLKGELLTAQKNLKRLRK